MLASAGEDTGETDDETRALATELRRHGWKTRSGARGDGLSPAACKQRRSPAVAIFFSIFRVLIAGCKTAALDIHHLRMKRRSHCGVATLVVKHETIASDESDRSDPRAPGVHAAGPQGSS